MREETSSFALQTNDSETRVRKADDTMRILYVIDTLEPGGAEQSLLHLAANLHQDFKPQVVTLYRGNSLRSSFLDHGIDVHCLESDAKYGFGSLVRQLRSLVRQIEPDLIHATLYRANQVGRIAGWACSVPVVSTWSGIPYCKARFANESMAGYWKTRALQALDLLTSRTVTHFHAVSSSARVQNCSALRVGSDRVSVIPRGREIPPAGEFLPDVLTQLRESLRIGCRQPVILNVGRLVPAKGQVTLISAMRHVIRELPTAVLLIAGEGPLRTQLQSQIDDHGLQENVRLLGHRSDVDQLLALADLFVFPSVHEGFPGALLEAMLAGRPIVAANIPAVAEMLPEDCALFVPPIDVKALAKQIVRLSESRLLSAQLGQAARASAIERFDLRRVTREMETLYQRIVSQNDRKPK